MAGNRYFCVMNLPDSFVQMIEGLVPAEAQPLLHAISTTAASVSVRVNVQRGAAVPQGAQRVPWCPAGFYLQQRQPFTFDTDWHAGRYYVQDASSMFIGHVITSLVHGPVRYLDLCAAPGGKATAALTALPAGSLLVANEVVPARARALVDNVMRWGNPHAVVASSQPAQWGQKMRHFFDVVAADVPCSGEGMMRKDDEAVAQWSAALVEQCAARQQSIVSDVWPALRPGGLFIYSTCTYNRRENEDMVQWLIDRLGAEPVTVPVHDEWSIHPAIDAHFPAYRFMPHRTPGEGLFMAVLRKPDERMATSLPRKVKTGREGIVPAAVKSWLSDDVPMVLSEQAGTVVAVPRAHEGAVATLRQDVNVIHAGVALATVKGKSCVPHHALALSMALRPGAFAAAEVDYRTAMAYLRGETITVDAPRGPVLVTRRGAALGWVNNLGNRANNLYPKGLRVLSSHIPDAEPEILGRH